MTTERRRNALDMLLRGLRDGDTGALARLITLVEEQGAEARAAVSAAYGYTRGSRSIGVTGPPGVGKSTLVSRLVGRYQPGKTRMAVLAVDPSSPLTGGALLGDRVRLDTASAASVFYRSMASRGSVGGLAAATGDALVLLDAAGYELIFVETVGSGQGDLSIAHCADMTVLLLSPNSGDLIQAMKAGIAELADIFIVNKSDLSGADETRRSVEQSLRWRKWQRGERVPRVLPVSATAEQGLGELLTAIDETYTFLESSGHLAQRRRLRMQQQLQERIRTLVWERLRADEYLTSAVEEQVERIVRRESDPYTAAEILLNRHFTADGAVAP